MSESPRLHPVSQNTLPVFTMVTFALGTYCLNKDDDATTWGLVWFAWSIATFMLHVLAWVLRGHELWRSERSKQPAD